MFMVVRATKHMDGETKYCKVFYMYSHNGTPFVISKVTHE